MSNGQFIPIKKFMDLHLEKMIKEDKNKYQTERMLTYAKSTTIEAKSDKDGGSTSGKTVSESTRNSAASKELLPRHMSSVNVELQPSVKEAESIKGVRKDGSSIHHDSGMRVGEHKGVDVTDISTDSPVTSQWVTASRSVKGGGYSIKKRGINNLNSSEKYNLNVRDKSPQVYRGDALNEALRG